MNHQTYEEWALMPEFLSPEERQSLEEHQKECESCRRLAMNWSQVETLLLHTAPVSPAPGFTARFAASLETRKAKEHKRQIIKFLFVLGVIFLVSMAVVSIFYYTTNSPAVIIKGIFETGAQVVTLWENIKTVVGSLTRLTPTVFLISALVFTSIVVSGVTMVWMATIWKFSLAGGKVK